MNLTLVEVTGPEPVSLSQAKRELRRDDISDEDTLILAKVASARERVEEFLDRDVVARTWDLKLSAFPDSKITLDRTPVQGVASISYIDAAGATQALAADAYDVVKGEEEAHIIPAYGASWPSSRDHPGSVTVRFTTGYTTVPKPICSAILLLVVDLYNNRSNSVTSGAVPKQVTTSAEYLLDPYRRLGL